MQKSLWILLPALGLGVAGKYLLGDALYHNAPSGAGFSVWILLNLIAATLVVRLLRQKSLPAILFLIPAAFAAIGYSTIDSPWLKAMDLSVIALSTSFSCFTVASGGPVFTGIARVFAAIITGTCLPIFGAIDLFCYDLSYKGLINEKQKPLLRAIIKGVVITAPLLLIFTSLFCAADQKFTYLLTHFVNFNFGNAFVDSVVISSLTACSAGILRTLGLLSNEYQPKAQAHEGANTKEAQEKCEIQTELDAQTTNTEHGPLKQSNWRSSLNVPESEMRSSIQDSIAQSAYRNSVNSAEDSIKAKLGFIECATGLTLINLLFACFVVVQVRYLFGGAATIAATSGLNYSEYARHGFFELCTVASLVLPLLLTTDAICVKTTNKTQITFKLLSGTLIALVMVVMASAMQRMQLYTAEYGLSELRFYTQAFMVWLAAVCIIFVGTVLRANRGLFAKLSYGAGLISIAVLHIINPDAMIQRTNLSMAKLQKYDTAYALTLSNDGIPALLKGLPQLPGHQQREIADCLLARRSGAWHTDWRAFNWSRMQAYNAVQDHLKELEATKQFIK